MLVPVRIPVPVRVPVPTGPERGRRCPWRSSRGWPRCARRPPGRRDRFGVLRGAPDGARGVFGGPAGEHPPQQRPYRLAHQQRQRQVEQRGQPQVARPGQHLLEGEREAGPAPGEGAHGRQGQHPHRDRAGPAREGALGRRVTDQAAPDIAVHPGQQRENRDRHQDEDDYHLRSPAPPPDRTRPDLVHVRV
ncbi:hypothetical protein GCM10020227_45340 [Streptomyces flavovirens]